MYSNILVIIAFILENHLEFAVGLQNKNIMNMNNLANFEILTYSNITYFHHPESLADEKNSVNSILMVSVLSEVVFR